VQVTNRRKDRGPVWAGPGPGIQKPIWTKKSVRTDFTENHGNQKTGRFLVQSSISEIWERKMVYRAVFSTNHFFLLKTDLD
jgi:hypothetical protein